MIVIDFASYAQTLPNGPLSPDVRPDGVHFEPDALTELVRSWIGPELLDAYREARSAN
jgi:hypothetical protein